MLQIKVMESVRVQTVRTMNVVSNFFKNHPVVSGIFLSDTNSEPPLIKNEFLENANNKSKHFTCLIIGYNPVGI